MKFCAECEQSFDTKLTIQMYCSKRCRRVASNRASNDRKKEKRRSGVKVHHPKIRNCRTCNVEFQALMGSNRQYCSDKCRARAGHSKKKVRRTVAGSDARLCLKCMKTIIASGLCYDCASPGTRTIRPATWLYVRRRNPRFGSDGGAVSARIAA